MMRRLIRWSVVVGVVCMAFGTRNRQAFAYQNDALEDPIVTGQIIESIVARGDPSQSFCLYIPAAYSADQQWPIVFVMDPRGNSLVPLRRLVPVAERLGYIVASSNNTASDVEGDPNAPAVNAIIATLQPRLTLDLRRFYLFGMSGTARAAWGLGYAAIPHVAGVAGFAAGLPPDMDLEAAQGQYGAPFVFFGGVGAQDFNHPELVLLESQLRRLGFRYSVSYYKGRHG
jgi:poly(3-hydroxybutyrate) depolymerase